MDTHTHDKTEASWTAKLSLLQATFAWLSFLAQENQGKRVMGTL